jgi:hypothetical protein
LTDRLTWESGLSLIIKMFIRSSLQDRYHEQHPSRYIYEDLPIADRYHFRDSSTYCMQLLPCKSRQTKRFALGISAAARAISLALQRKSCKCLGTRKYVGLQMCDKKLGRYTKYYQEELITPSIHSFRQFARRADRLGEGSRPYLMLFLQHSVRGVCNFMQV